jgi:hypothetical protein
MRVYRALVLETSAPQCSKKSIEDEILDKWKSQISGTFLQSLSSSGLTDAG